MTDREPRTLEQSLAAEVDRLREENRRLVEAIQVWEKRLRRMTISADGFPILQELRAAIEGSK